MVERNWKFCGACGTLLKEEETHTDGCPKQQVEYMKRIQQLTNDILVELRRRNLLIKDA